MNKWIILLFWWISADFRETLFNKINIDAMLIADDEGQWN
jgi:hypothetical protein